MSLVMEGFNETHAGAKFYNWTCLNANAKIFSKQVCPLPSIYNRLSLTRAAQLLSLRLAFSS